jgi:hypothetical protein
VNRKPSECLRDLDSKQSTELAARDILKKLNGWLDLNKRDIVVDKWVWELIQNARDVAKKQEKEVLRISIKLDNKESRLVFQHDGGPFSLNDISSLINGRSLKPLEDPEIIGKFAEGFIVTHILSREVSVRGWLKDENIDKSFEIRIDRRKQSNDELTFQHIKSNIEKCYKDLDMEGPNIDRNITVFDYNLDEDGRNAASRGLEELKDVIPFVLVFAGMDITIEVDNGQKTIYKVIDKKTLNTDRFGNVIEQYCFCGIEKKV